MRFLFVKPRALLFALTIPLCLFLPSQLTAQSSASLVKGLVQSSTGVPLQGVSVVIKNSQTNFAAGTDTDSAGVFLFTNVPPGGPYSFSFSSVGYQDQTLSGYDIKQGITLSIVVNLVETSSTLDQVVVIGYGTSKKKNVTGSVVSVSQEEIAQRSPTNAFEAIQGQMSGVQITTSSGAPGDNSSLRIRGVSTFDAGATPLYIVDGQPLDNIDNINPNDISSIEVLKDGSSAAIYGSKSANGVVIVTTKSGKKGESKINMNYLRSYTTARIMPVATTNGGYAIRILGTGQKHQPGTEMPPPKFPREAMRAGVNAACGPFSP